MPLALKTTKFLFWFFSIGVALASYRFLALPLEISFPDMMTHVTNQQLVFLAHISAAPIALVFGLFQFLPRLHSKYPVRHRWNGRIYALAVLTAGIAGLLLAIGSIERPAAASGFVLLAIIWLAVTAQAVRLAMAGRIVEHRRWMIRSFALTFAAVTLRLYLPLFFFLGDMDYAASSNYVAWLCWIPNLLVAEYYLRRGRQSGGIVAA